MYFRSQAPVVIWRNCRDDVRSVRLGGMTGSLRLSALLLLLLSRWASADLEKGEDEYVRSWVIIEEQLVPPSRDEPLATGGVGTAVGGGGTGRRITPKSVFVAPSFNKCSDGYRPDTMGRCVKVVKINQAAQWDFLLKQINSMYGAGGSGGVGFPMMPGGSAYRPAAMQATTTTFEPPTQKTDSPGPFQLNIPLGGGVGDAELYNQTMDSVMDELTTGTTTTTTTTAGTTTTTIPTTTTAAAVAGSTTVAEDDDAATSTDQSGTTSADYPDDRTSATDIVTETTDTARPRPRPYRNRYQTTTGDEDVTVTVTPSSYDSTSTVTYAKTK